MAETIREQERRTREGYFERYFVGKGIDIGCGDDLVVRDCDRWDQKFGHGDATLMTGVGNEVYDWVHSSHCLEHLNDPRTALKNWWRILKSGGHMVLLVPHREYYEKKKTLPSIGNPDHKFFIMPFHDEAPDTLGLVPLLERSLVNMEIVQLRICLPPAYSIEVVVRKTL